MGEKRVAWRPLILGMLVCASAFGAETDRLAQQSADEAGPPSLSTGNRAIDLLLQQPQAEQPPAMAASRAPTGKAGREQAPIAGKQLPAEDSTKLTRDALLREAAQFVEQQEQKQAKAGRATDDGVEVMASRPGTSGQDPSHNAPPALEGWRATVKELAIALRENREWIIGIAALIGVAVLSVRSIGLLGLNRRGRHGAYQAGRR